LPSLATQLTSQQYDAFKQQLRSTLRFGCMLDVQARCHQYFQAGSAGWQCSSTPQRRF
jgi:hypothetical protein